MRKPNKAFRLDQLLVGQGLVETMAKAKALIMAGQVVVDEQRCDKPGMMIKPEQQVRLKKAGKFVSRGGDKLESAITKLNLTDSFKEKYVLDVGSSTGGFSDCALSYGAKSVVALDVGSNQLAWKLRQDTRVISLEQTDIRDFEKKKYPDLDWIIGDISFNSIANLLPSILEASVAKTKFLLLIKPQFELAKEDIPEGGVVRDKQLIEKAVNKVKMHLLESQLQVLGVEESGTKGRQGNQEIFILFQHHP